MTIKLSPSVNQQTFIDTNCLEGLLIAGPDMGKSTALILSAMEYVHLAHYSAIIFTRDLTKIRPLLMELGLDNYWSLGDRLSFQSGAGIQLAQLRDPLDVLQYISADYQFVGFDDLSAILFELSLQSVSNNGTDDINPYVSMLARLRKPIRNHLPLRMRATDELLNMNPFVKSRFGTERVVVWG